MKILTRIINAKNAEHGKDDKYLVIRASWFTPAGGVAGKTLPYLFIPDDFDDEVLNKILKRIERE